jgi:hypothetical protein
MGVHPHAEGAGALRAGTFTPTPSPTALPLPGLTWHPVTPCPVDRAKTLPTRESGGYWIARSSPTVFTHLSTSDCIVEKSRVVSATVWSSKAKRPGSRGSSKRLFSSRFLRCVNRVGSSRAMTARCRCCRAASKFSPISRRLYLDFTTFREHAAAAVMAYRRRAAMISEGDLR